MPDSLRTAVRTTMAKPPQTNVMTAIMVIQALVGIEGKLEEAGFEGGGRARSRAPERPTRG